MATSGSPDRRPFLARPIDVGPVVRWVRSHPARTVLLAGALARLVQYLWGRPSWMDEESLRANIVGKSLAGLFGPLAATQLAPPGFLVVEWGVSRTLGDSLFALRLFSLLGGLASLWLFDRVARRVSRPSAFLAGLALFAASDDLIYFASELKQYGTDVAAALAVTLLALRLGDAAPALWPRRASELGALGAAAVWFSHPSAFVLGGVGTTLIGVALARGRYSRAGAVALLGLAWLLSFAGVYLVAMEQLGHKPDMWTFWDFAFPPRPARSAWDWTWYPRRLLYLFVNPMSFATPLGPRVSALPALALFGVGAASLACRRPSAFALLAAPMFVTLAANAFRLYPFHGRLVLFLVPSLLLAIAEGAGAVLDAFPGRAVRRAVLASILLFPALTDVYHLAVPRDRTDFNRLGDYRDDGVDPDWFPFDPPARGFPRTRPGEDRRRQDAPGLSPRGRARRSGGGRSNPGPGGRRASGRGSRPCRRGRRRRPRRRRPWCRCRGRARRRP